MITTVLVGWDPVALAYNLHENKIYCANYRSENVNVIDGSGDSVVATIQVGNWPVALVYNPTNNKIYCANSNYYPEWLWDNGDISIIDGAGDSLITTVEVGYYPRSLSYNSSNNKIYCANYNSGDVTIIDGAGDSVTSNLRVEAQPRALVYNPNSNRIYCANYGASNISVIACSPSTAVEEDQETQVIPGFSLKQNYPNPFNPSTKILFTVYSSQFTVHRPIHTTLKIYNILGHKVKTLVNEPKRAGNHEVIWDGKDDQGKDVASGIYFYQLKVGDFAETKKMLLLK